jgi:succinyl-CoA synthetase alpha subunit
VIVPVWNFIRHNAYHDSVTLMRLTRDMEAVPGVTRAAAMMGTPPNRALLAGAALLTTDGERAGPTDLVIAIVADTAQAADAAQQAAESALTARPAAADARARPRTLDGALRALPGATLALVSVPGPYAGAEARAALRRGLDVMLFSDNVPLATEVALKREALERGRFVMGPDCGTAILHGVPLGFANAVPRGRIGLVAASGTGLQEITCRLAATGEGVSHAIGVGSRDLSDEVGGAMTLAALAALASDVATEVVVIVGKPPGKSVVERLAAAVAALAKPTVVSLMGSTAFPATRGVHVAATLEDAALAATALARGQAPGGVELALPAAEVEQLVEECGRALAPGQRFVRGVYAGGTLAWEARGLLAARLSNVAPGVDGDGTDHRVVDLGDDHFTVGRPHPMIDGTVRREWIEREARDLSTAVLLLDVVLGYGAHPDPAGELLPALQSARRQAAAARRGLVVVTSVIGTERDPQVRSSQVAALRGAGVLVMDSNAQAARLAALIAAHAGRARR